MCQESYAAAAGQSTRVITPLGLVLSPRRTIGELAARPRLGPGLLAVLAAGTASLLLSLASARLEPASAPGAAAAVAVSLSLPLLFLGFWALSGWLVGGAARAMGAGSRRREYLAVSAHLYPLLIAYEAIAVGQAAALRWAGGAGGALSDAVGLLSLPLLLWFVALLALAARRVYGTSVMAALALALLPFAALCAALLVLVLIATALRA